MSKTHTLRCLALLLLALPLAAAGAEPAPAAGRVGSESIPRADVEAAVRPALDKAQSEHDSQVRQLDFELALHRAAILEAEVRQRLDDRVLALESAARHQTREQLLGALTPAPVPDADVRAFYDEHRADIGQPFERVAPEIHDYLGTRAHQAAESTYLKSLRARYHAYSTLEPLRITVEASGPARGPASAPVTLIEFGDFQCPYCGQMEPVLADLAATYPKDLRLVFRHLPLTSIHPQALGAARAAVCASRQGRFWELHDALYQHQTALGEDAIKATARRVGLDGDAFDACLANGRPELEVERDLNAADAIGIASTPAFLINGRFFGGAVPAETLKETIDDELARQRAPAAGR